MRPSAPVESLMPTGKAYIGWWGNMGGPKQKGVVTYSVSPFRQRALKGTLHGYIFNGYSRAMRQAPYMLIPFGVGYAVYAWASEKSAYYNSKEGHHAMAMAEGGH
ncbi:hypothetical protein NliqN6_6747 [Naganishia liquefaciens]|uniref:Cytochrome b-c1 complex subunit 8 n=1 Tax=Naganishia liquefaciens TaxID=104408 RepID=A0A8H3U0L7_9TREE|nr:hypothetical protein NliqN6_6747 [Naganishia liquefaciens]